MFKVILHFVSRLNEWSAAIKAFMMLCDI